MRTPVAHPGKPCPLPIRPAALDHWPAGNAVRPAGPVWPFDPFAPLHPGSAAGRRPSFALAACCRSCRSAGPAPAAVVDPATLARCPAAGAAALDHWPAARLARWPACCRGCRSAGPAPAAVVDPATLARRAAGHGRRHGPPWLPRCWPCNDHATQHATHHAAAASRRRGVRPMMQRLRRCSYRDAMHHHATRAPQVATPTVLPLSLRSSCARAFHEATPPKSSKKFPGTQYQKRYCVPGKIPLRRR